MVRSISLKAARSPSPALALSNFVYLSPDDFRAFGNQNPLYVTVRNFVFLAKEEKLVQPQTIAFNAIQRGLLDAELDTVFEVKNFEPSSQKNIYLSTVELEVNLFKKSANPETFDCVVLSKKVHDQVNGHILTVGQKLIVDAGGINLVLDVLNVDVVDLAYLERTDDPSKAPASKDTSTATATRGLLHNKTAIMFVKGSGANITLRGASRDVARTPFKHDWNFEKLGIGGLNKEFNELFRRAFASRIVPPAVVEKMGVNHVKGILLYGPPGTGKTLIARQIGKMLNGREPVIVNGPEVLNKYVGQSEENVRKLFAPAEKEWAERGDESDLHIIIFDEIDAICKQRGSTNTGTGVHDTLVNQLLSKIDGVNSLNNILIIGMTNRKDMIDEALLRPGRLEVHMEIGLPDESGREEIFRIHTTKMKSNGYLADDVNLKELAAHTKNYTGAEIEGVVKSASSYAFDRQVDTGNLKKSIDPTKIQVCRADFMCALEEIRPKFGISDSEFESFKDAKLIDFGLGYRKVMQTLQMFIRQIHTSDSTNLISILLEGRIGCGKSSLAAKIALEGNFPFVKMITPESMVGHGELSKSSIIHRTFEDSYKSATSIVVIDEIERLLDYVRIGPRFSNVVLQTLFVLLKRPPPKQRRLMIVATTSCREIIEDMGLIEAFNAVLTVPSVQPGVELVSALEQSNIFRETDLEFITNNILQPIPIKKLLMIAEMVKDSPIEERAVEFLRYIEDYGGYNRLDDILKQPN